MFRNNIQGGIAVASRKHKQKITPMIAQQHKTKSKWMREDPGSTCKRCKKHKKTNNNNTSKKIACDSLERACLKGACRECLKTSTWMRPALWVDASLSGCGNDGAPSGSAEDNPWLVVSELSASKEKIWEL